MKIKTLLLGAAAASILATAAIAGGLYTPGFPALLAANMVGTETLPIDTNYASGRSPQTASLAASQLKTYTNGGAIVTGTSASGAVTANGERIFITTESLTTAAGAVFTDTITDSSVAASSVALCSVGFLSATTGIPIVATVTPGAGSLVVKVMNNHASAALNGTLTIACRISS